MGNRAAIYFSQQSYANPAEEHYLGVQLHWNGGPASIYAFAKTLASYSLSQSDPRSRPDNTARCDPSSLAPRFLQLATNYFSSDKSDFLNVYLSFEPGTPSRCKMPTENGIYLINSDFSIDRYDYARTGQGRKWTARERIAEFAEVLQHPYWQDGKHNIFPKIRDPNDRLFLMPYQPEEEIPAHGNAAGSGEGKGGARNVEEQDPKKNVVLLPYLEAVLPIELELKHHLEKAQAKKRTEKLSIGLAR